MTIKYFHPSVGTYYEKKGIQLRASDLVIGGAAAGLGLVALPRNSKALAIPAGIGGALLSNLLAPKKILSWYNPPPNDKPAVYPPDIPDKVVPSYIDDDGIVLDWLMYNGEGDLEDYTKYKNRGKLNRPVAWVAGSQGWAVAFDDSQIATLPPIIFPNGSEWAWEGWMSCSAKYTGVHQALFSNAGGQPLFFLTGNLKYLYYYGDKYILPGYVGVVYREVNLVPYHYYQLGINSRSGKIEFVLNGQVLTPTGNLYEGHNSMIFSQFGEFWKVHKLTALTSIQRVYARTLSPAEWLEHFESTRGIFQI